MPAPSLPPVDPALLRAALHAQVLPEPSPWPAVSQEGIRAVLLRRQSDIEPTLAALAPCLPASLDRAVPRRRQEFLLGRLAAREAVLALGCPPERAWVGQEGRRPVWPPGLTGSISHTDRRVLAVAARCSEGVRSLGVDLESLRAGDEAVHAIRACFAPVEREALAAHRHGLVAGFALKEALYKCVQPLVGGWIDFEDVWVEWEAEAARPARLRLLRTLGPGFEAGRVLLGHVSFPDGDHVCAALAC